MTTAASQRRPRVGDAVRLAPGAPSGSILNPGDIGTLVADDNSDMPFHVRGPQGGLFWYRAEQIEVARARPTVGDRVRAADGTTIKELPQGRDGVVVADDHSDRPFQVRCPDGQLKWFLESQVALVDAATMPSISRLVIGSRVRLAPGRPNGENLRTDEVGILITDDNSDRPYEVLCPRGTKVWFTEHELVSADGSATAACRLKVGSRVRLAPGQDGDKLRKDEVGILITDDHSDRPYEVLCPRDGAKIWFKEGELVAAS